MAGMSPTSSLLGSIALRNHLSNFARFRNDSNFRSGSCWGFAAGVLSTSIFLGASFLVWVNHLKPRLLDDDYGEDDDSVTNSSTNVDSKRTRYRRRWNWDRIRRRRPARRLLKPLLKKLFGKVGKATGYGDADNVSHIPQELGVDIGSIFGLDVGGTLAKLVYFDVGSSEEERNFSSQRSLSSITSSDDSMLVDTSKRRSKQSPMRKSLSISDLCQQPQHAEALKSFYEFANYLDSFGETGLKEKHLSFHSRALDGEFHFLQFETRNMVEMLNIIKENHLHANISEIGATGGGAHKYASMLESILGLKLKKISEMESMVAGMQFVLGDGNVVGETYTFKPDSTSCEESSSSENGVDALNMNDSTLPTHRPRKRSLPKGAHVDENWSKKVQLDRPLDASSYPYLVVIIGTGVSILRVDGPRKHERISGSTIGGGTYWGLCRLLTDMEDYDDVMNHAELGDPSKVDMMVGDIYGKNSDALEKLGLPASVVASSFGKLVAKQDPAEGIKQEDLARALLVMISNNIAQVAYLNAQLHNTSRIYFVGNFLRQNNIAQRRLAYAIDYWSAGKMEALFLEHEGHFGALGAFLLSQGIPPHESFEAEDSRGRSKVQLIGRSNSFEFNNRRSGSLTRIGRGRPPLTHFRSSSVPKNILEVEQNNKHSSNLK